jgi:hypothetical protein
MIGKRVAKLPKGQMARQLVYYCIAVLTVTAVWAMVMKTIDHAIDLSDVLTFVGAAFGGELLLLAFKRVFSKPTEQEE